MNAGHPGVVLPPAEGPQSEENGPLRADFRSRDLAERTQSFGRGRRRRDSEKNAADFLLDDAQVAYEDTGLHLKVDD